MDQPMLYHLREMQRSLLQPLSASADAFSKLYASSPFSMAPFAKTVAASFELMHRLGKDYEKPRFNLTSTTIEGREVAVIETVELNKPFCRLLKFAREGRTGDPKVLLFAPLSGHFATLLRDTVRTMLPEHEVYVTDWVDAREVPVSEGTFGFDDYVAYSIEFMRHLGPDVHVVAVCQPTVPVLAAIAVMSTLGDASLPRSMTLMGGPVDPRKTPTTVNTLATERDFSWFKDNLIYTVPPNHPGAGRKVYPGFLQHLAFVSMNPERHTQSHWDYFLSLVKGDKETAEGHRAFYDEYNAVLDMDAAFYLETVRLVFQEHALPRGVLDVKFEGKTVRVAPQDIKVPALFTIEGELDDIAGPGQTEAALGLCSSIPAARKQHHVAPGAGHYGIFSGRRWRESIYPQLRAFIRAS
jgi:poly(3-hydroxybutyrate) depolymerase